jgi:hypothetical protein
LERLSGWFHRLHFPHVAFYAELWRDPKEDPSFPALAEKYGEDQGDPTNDSSSSHDRLQAGFVECPMSACTGSGAPRLLPELLPIGGDLSRPEATEKRRDAAS